MFKKSNRNFRLKNTGSDNEDNKINDDDENKYTNNDSNQSKDIKFEKPIRSLKPPSSTTNTTTSSVLSFDLAEEDEDTFQIKKSKESRRIAKEKKKEKKQHEHDLKVDLSVKSEDSSSQLTDVKSEDILYNEGIKIKPLNVTSKLDATMKNLTFTSNEKKPVVDTEDYDEKLQRLRAEMADLGGDADDDEFDENTDDAKRSMKILLKCGQIPDASMIHELKKKRQQARQGDYIPIDDVNQLEDTKSRMIREDDNDLSDNEERVSFDVLEKSNRDMQTTRDTFLQYEQGSDNDEDDEDVFERWEREQIRKGVQITQNVISKTPNTGTSALENYIGLTIKQQPMDIEDETKPSSMQLDSLPAITFESLKKTIRENLNYTNDAYRMHSNEKSMITENLDASRDTLLNLKLNKPKYDEQYKFYQEMKSYLTDIVDCYDEKLYEIEKIEANILNLREKHSQKLQIRHQKDVQDENTENLVNMNTVATYNLVMDGVGTKRYTDAVHQRRSIDRDNRRNRRKKLRELSDNLHFEGLSSDDEETPSDLIDFSHKKNDIVSKVPEIFKDTLDDFHDMNIIKSRFEEWHSRYPATYEDAYVGLSLPKLFSPLIRIELIDWDPLNSFEKLEHHNWWKVLNTYGDNLTDKTNDDALLISRIVEKVIFEKLKSLVDTVYYPFSSKHNRNLTQLFQYIFDKYPHLMKSSHTQLFSNILEWNDIVSTELLKELTLDCLLNRYIIVALQYMDLNIETVDKIEYFVKKLPYKWFENLENNQTLTQLKNLCRILHLIVDNIHRSLQDTKLELKTFREHIRQIRKLFVSIKAMDHAIDLTNKYNIK